MAACIFVAQVTSKEFAFPKKHNMPLFFCSASDGTNVVSAFTSAIENAVKYSKAPSDDFVDQVRIAGLSRAQPLRDSLRLDVAALS